MAAPVLCGAKIYGVPEKATSELVKYDDSASFTYNPISIAAVDVIDTADLAVEPVSVIVTAYVTFDLSTAKLDLATAVREREALPDVRSTGERSYKRFLSDLNYSCRLEHSPDTGYVIRC